MTRSDPLRISHYLDHICTAIESVFEYTRGMDAPGYLADRKTQDAVIRNLEIVGEACNRVVKLHPEFAALHPEVAWSLAYEMRNVLSHGYFSVDHQIVWKTILNDLPVMLRAVNLLRLDPTANN